MQTPTGTALNNRTKLVRYVTASVSSHDEVGQNLDNLAGTRVTDSQAYGGYAIRATAAGTADNAVIMDGPYYGSDTNDFVGSPGVPPGNYRVTVYVRVSSVASGNPVVAFDAHCATAGVVQNDGTLYSFNASDLGTGYVGASFPLVINNDTRPTNGLEIRAYFHTAAGVDLYISHIQIEQFEGLVKSEVTTNFIANLAVTDAKINTLTVAKLTAGTMTADVTQSGIIRTGPDTGARVVMDSAGIHAYSNATNKTVDITSAGAVNITGTINATGGVFTGTVSGGTFQGATFQTSGGTGARVVIDSSGLTAYNSSNSPVTTISSASGAFSSNSATITGTINATGGTFSGSISVTGTISGGTLSGATITGGTLTGALVTGSTVRTTASTGVQRVEMQASTGQMNFINASDNSVGMYALPSGGGVHVAGNFDCAQLTSTVVYDQNNRVYSAVNPPPYPVTQVGGQTGNVTSPNFAYVADSGYRVYSPVNTPPYPVTSVNGNTGAVTVARDNALVGYGSLSGTVGIDDDGSIVRIYVNGNPQFKANHTAWANWSGSKTFVIPHPTDITKYLVHAASEGPTADVHYRGQGRLDGTVEGKAVITLPSYFEALTQTEGRTVLVTPLLGCEADCPVMKERENRGYIVPNLAVSQVVDGQFTVMFAGGWDHRCARFFWEVKAVRKDVPQFEVEPSMAAYSVAGEGPYTYLVRK